MPTDYGWASTSLPHNQFIFQVLYLPNFFSTENLALGNFVATQSLSIVSSPFPSRLATQMACKAKMATTASNESCGRYQRLHGREHLSLSPAKVTGLAMGLLKSVLAILLAQAWEPPWKPPPLGHCQSHPLPGSQQRMKVRIQGCSYLKNKKKDGIINPLPLLESPWNSLP